MMNAGLERSRHDRPQGNERQQRVDELRSGLAVVGDGEGRRQAAEFGRGSGAAGLCHGDTPANAICIASIHPGTGDGIAPGEGSPGRLPD